MIKNRKIDRSPLVKHIQSHQSQIETMSVAKDQYPDSELNLIASQNWLEMESTKSKTTIDCRSESEFEESHLPGAINFPILNNKERDEVGFLYKHFSPNAALFHANNIAESKKDEIEEFAKTLENKSNIFVYCWRGGARSAAFSHILQNRGIKLQKIIGGYKSFRRIIHTALYENPEQFNFLVLSGLTGCGKTEILEKIINNAPVLDIEKAALHASSLFGEVRFFNKADTVTTQQDFETRLFMQLYNAKKDFGEASIFTESESRKISRFEIPGPLFDHLRNSPVIDINCPLKERAKRTAREYFYDGGTNVRKIVENSQFFHKKLGEKKVAELLDLIDSGESAKFCEWFLGNYYDVHYKSLYGKVVATVDNDNVEKVIDEILEISNKL